MISSGLKRVAKREWGLGLKALKTIYKGLFLAMTTYAASVWIDLINKKDWTKLTSAQRFALIGVTCSYRSVSLDAVQVLAGEMPIDLEARRRSTNYAIRKGLEVKINERIYQGDPDDKTRNSEIRRKVRNILLEEWQNRWRNSSKGRVTYEYLPDIRERLKMTWLESNFYLSQMITGHGDFAEKLTKLKLKENPNCICGSPDNSDHLLVECNLFDDERRKLINKCVDNGVQWPANRTKLLTKDILPDLKDFAAKALRRKEEDTNRV